MSATCRTCHFATLTPDERQRAVMEPVVSTIYLCPEHQKAEDAIWAKYGHAIVKADPAMARLPFARLTPAPSGDQPECICGDGDGVGFCFGVPTYAKGVRRLPRTPARRTLPRPRHERSHPMTNYDQRRAQVAAAIYRLNGQALYGRDRGEFDGDRMEAERWRWLEQADLVLAVLQPEPWRPPTEPTAAESALRQVRELHVKVDHAWEDKHWCEADGREWPCQTIAALDSARVGAADTQPEGAVSVPLRWVDEVAIALDSASIIGARSCRPGDGLNLANHDRLIREAQQWSVYARSAKSLPDDDAPTAGGKVDTAPEACPLDAGERPYWMGVDQYDPCKCLLTKGHEPPCVCSHTAPADSAPESGEGR